MSYFETLEKEIQHYFIEALIYLKLPLISLNLGKHKLGTKESVAFYQSQKKYIKFNLCRS